MPTLQCRIYDLALNHIVLRLHQSRDLYDVKEPRASLNLMLADRDGEFDVILSPEQDPQRAAVVEVWYRGYFENADCTWLERSEYLTHAEYTQLGYPQVLNVKEELRIHAAPAMLL